MSAQQKCAPTIDAAIRSPARAQVPYECDVAPLPTHCGQMLFRRAFKEFGPHTALRCIVGSIRWAIELAIFIAVIHLGPTLRMYHFPSRLLPSRPIH